MRESNSSSKEPVPKKEILLIENKHLTEEQKQFASVVGRILADRFRTSPPKSS
jgi:hypothetical protein